MSKNRDIALWLLSGCLLIAAMVVIGGITRLTNSGLSMVDWKPIMGAIPPLNDNEWNDAFEAYKSSPEFNLLNYHFAIEDFKSIFWWEYIHRLLGRFIGIVFIIPFIYFLAKRRFSGQWIGKLVILLLMGAFQGVLGWYMVKSGLVKDPHVSHYRLAAHLVTALILFSYCLWLTLDILKPNERYQTNRSKFKIASIALLVLIFVQIAYGAFVAGLNAGLVYNTFPMMGSQWIPDSISYSFNKAGISSILENMVTVQFIHRYLAIIIVVLVIALWIYIRRDGNNHKLIKTGSVLLLIVSIQFLLGVLTLLFHVPIVLGVLHQGGAIFLLSATIWLVHQQK